MWDYSFVRKQVWLLNGSLSASLVIRWICFYSCASCDTNCPPQRSTNETAQSQRSTNEAAQSQRPTNEGGQYWMFSLQNIFFLQVMHPWVIHYSHGNQTRLTEIRAVQWLHWGHTVIRRQSSDSTQAGWIRAQLHFQIIIPLSKLWGCLKDRAGQSRCGVLTTSSSLLSMEGNVKVISKLPHAWPHWTV